MHDIPRIDIIPLSDARLEETRSFLRELLLQEFMMVARLKEMDDLSQSYHKGRGSFWIAVDIAQDRVIGCVGLLDVGDDRGYLKRMYIHADYRAIGLGKRLLLQLLDHAQTHGMREVYLATDHSMEAAQKFYARHGFRRIEQLPPDLDPFGDPIFYIRTLSPSLETSSRAHAANYLHRV
jgi:N-acetylglutamate synthase-like GNAT family acetyltransferase